jgi:hypothetical protein
VEVQVNDTEKIKLEIQRQAFMSIHETVSKMDREYQIRTIAAVAVLLGIDADLIQRLKAAKP